MTKLTDMLIKTFDRNRRGSKHVSILDEEGTKKMVLRFQYWGHEVKAESYDYAFLDMLRTAIEVYLSEVEEEEV